MFQLVDNSIADVENLSSFAQLLHNYKLDTKNVKIGSQIIVENQDRHLALALAEANFINPVRPLASG